MSSPENFLGHIIGDYQLKQILGKGGTSVVFLGERITSPQELVAVKVLLPPPYLSADDLIECRKRFVCEILTLGQRLHHRSILPILASGEDASTKCAYMVVPYISGGSLMDHLAKGKLPLNKIPGYVMQIAEALDYAHRQQVIHRDLKPANVLIDEEEHVYLVDFGIAKIFDSALGPISQPGQAVGTPGYMAPEQARGASVSSATDIYGLAVLTYTLVTRRLPFPPAGVGDMLRQVATMPPIPPRTFRPDLSEPAEAVLLRALNKDPSKRFATACEFAQAFEQSLKGDMPLLPEAMPVIPNNTLEVHVLQQTISLAVSGKHNRGPTLVSRRMALTGLISLGIVGISSSTLWYLLGTSSAQSVPHAPLLSKVTPGFFPTGGKTQQPPRHSTVTPTAQTTNPQTAKFPPRTATAGASPTATPSPASPSPTPPLSVATTNIPQQVHSKDTVHILATANQPGATMTLHVTYDNAPGQNYTSPQQIGDPQGHTTFTWSVPHLQQDTMATVNVTANNAQGQNAQSPQVRVQVHTDD